MSHRKRLKRSDAPLGQSPKTRRHTFGSSEHIHQSRIPVAEQTPPNDRIVFTTRGYASNHEYRLYNGANFDADTENLGYHILNGRIIIRRAESLNITRQNEIRNLSRLLFQVAVLREERTKLQTSLKKVPLHKYAERKTYEDQIQTTRDAERDLIFVEAERWGQMNQAITQDQKSVLPRVSDNFTQAAVNQFLDLPSSKRMIADYMRQIQSGKTEIRANDVELAASESAERAAMAGCVNSGTLMHASQGQRELISEGLLKNQSAAKKTNPKNSGNIISSSRKLAKAIVDLRQRGARA